MSFNCGCTNESNKQEKIDIKKLLVLRNNDDFNVVEYEVFLIFDDFGTTFTIESKIESNQHDNLNMAVWCIDEESIVLYSMKLGETQPHTNNVDYLDCSTDLKIVVFPEFEDVSFVLGVIDLSKSYDEYLEIHNSLNAE